VGVRADTALAAYTKAAEAHDDTGPGILAKLGQAGAYLDKKQWDAAKDGFEVVLKTPLATADVDVKARALEGKGFALEGKGDTEAAIAAFKELEGVDKSFEDLGKYHQARMHQKKGENDKAKELLVGLRKKLEVPTLDGAPQSWLRAAVEEVLREIDPASVPSKRKQLGGGMKGGATSPEEIQRILDQLQKKQQEGETGHDHE
jgi:tetratricopeptide (TPR) repeat protein